jgi:hypothetical protein
MTGLAIRVALIHCKSNVIVRERSIASDSKSFSTATIRVRRGKERISTFRTEEVLFVICSFSESLIIEGYKSFIDDRGFTRITPWSKILTKCQLTSADNYDLAHLMII